MGPSYFDGRVVSAADREGGAIVARARKFRAAEFLPELSAAWNGRSYVVSGSTPTPPVRHQAHSTFFPDWSLAAGITCPAASTRCHVGRPVSGKGGSIL
jgi:hypothetical protein